MYIVDVSNLKTLIKRLDTLLDEYQENYLNLYNDIKNSSSFWYDSHALRFFQLKELEKNDINISYEELCSTKDTYRLIQNGYERIGNYIEFNINNRNALLSKFNTYINKLNRILNSYNSLSYSFASSSVRSSIESQKRNVRGMIDEAQRVRDKVRDLLATIVDNENKIRKTLSNINIKVLQQPIIEGVMNV